VQMLTSRLGWSMNGYLEVIDGVLMMKRNVEDSTVTVLKMHGLRSIDDNPREASTLPKGTVGNRTHLVPWCIEGRI